MRLEINATIKSLTILNIFYWQLANVTDSFAFPKVSYMWNSIRDADDNGKFFALYYHFIQSNSDLSHI